MQQVGLGLHEERGAGEAAVDAQDRQRGAEVGRGGVGEFGDLGGEALAQGAHQVPGGGVQAEAGERAAQVAAPPGGGQPGQCRDEGDAAGVGHRGAHGVEVGGAGDDAEAGEPAYGGGGGVHLAVQAVVGAAAEPPGDAGGQARGAPARCAAGVGEEEGAGAVGALGGAGFGDALGEQRGLLVDGESGEREFGPEGPHRADVGGVVHDGREPFAGQAVQLQGARRPLDAVEVEELGAGGGRGVRDVGAGEAVDQPAVGGGDLSLAGEVPSYPGHFRCGEVRVQGQAGEVAQFVRVVAEFGTEGCRPAVLPDQCVGERAAGVRVPGEHRLALVGQAQRGDRLAGVGERPVPGVDHRAVQLLRVHLDQAAGQVAGPDLGESGADDAPFGADHQRLGAGRALVDGEYRVRHRHLPAPAPTVSAITARQPARTDTPRQE